MTRPRDVSALPPEISATAIVQDNGEIGWSIEDAEAAIEALSAAGQIILGLDMREYDQAGEFIEWPWSVYQPDGGDDLEQSRVEAVAALARADPVGTIVLITWRPAE